MKKPSTLLLLALCLTFGAFARAEPAANLPFELSTLEAGATAAPCAEDPLSLELAVFAPEAETKGYLPCGACSLSPCKNAPQGTNCGTQGGHCWDVYGLESCSVTTYIPKCRCWIGDLP